MLRFALDSLLKFDLLIQSILLTQGYFHFTGRKGNEDMKDYLKSLLPLQTRHTLHRDYILYQDDGRHLFHPTPTPELKVNY